MKKLVVFVFLLFCLAATLICKNVTNPIFAMNNVDKVCIVKDESCENLLDVEVVQCGDLFFNFCSLKDAKENLSHIKNYEAIQFYFSSMQVSKLLEKMKANVVSRETVGEIEIINAYTPYFSKNVIVQNKKVNLQIAENDGFLIAGFPMILTGY